MNSVRLGFRHQPFRLTSNPLPKCILITEKPHFRFARFSSGPNQRDQEMDPKKKSDPESKTTDTMSSFGEGYATRSDEEGFGGIYGGNEDDKKGQGHDVGKMDQNQGSEVKEKEKARNQNKVGD